jgi:hypothetical protein
MSRTVATLAALPLAMIAGLAAAQTEPIAPSPAAEPEVEVVPAPDSDQAPPEAPSADPGRAPDREEPASAPEPTSDELAPVPPEAGIPAPEPPEPPPDPPWYEKLRIRGYTQFRYNGLPNFDENDALINDQGDKYIGQGSGFGIRRARVILFGDVDPHVAVYLQTDFASAIGEQNHVAIVRDWYADLFVDSAREFRFRVGQSKVPYGFENLQSSQNRLPLDRADPLNSAVKDERDLGVFAYWAPAETRALFKRLVDDNLKGSGDYGVVGLGIYNGQTANRFDRNDNFHVIGRVSYPFEIGGQIIEIGGGGYTGLYRVSLQDQSDGTSYTTPDPNNDLRDARAFASFVLYAQPFGLLAEYTVGKGPQQGESDPTDIRSRKLHGGFVTATYMIEDLLGTVSLMPYVRAQLYEGGKKFETNAPRYDIREIEMGVEWQLLKALEITLVYTLADRTSSKYPYTQQQGHLGRVQVQVNY